MESNIKTKSLFVSIVGKANVGKSSIINMIINSKISIVSPKPQTTRNKVVGIYTCNNTQLVFTDTPGIHRPRTKLGKYMISEVNSSISGAEACMHVVECGKSADEFDKGLVEKFSNLKIPVILVLNKIDTLKDKTCIIEEMAYWNKIYNYSAIIPVCALTGDGRDALIHELFNLALPSVFFFDENDITDKTERELSAEIIREKMLVNLDKELPHGTAVYIEKFKNRSANIADIEAIIYCEKSNHKPIIIGKGGQMIKKIGIQSRKELENMLGCKVNLQLWVKVKENWRNRESWLYNLGYAENKS